VAHQGPKPSKRLCGNYAESDRDFPGAVFQFGSRLHATPLVFADLRSGGGGGGGGSGSGGGGGGGGQRRRRGGAAVVAATWGGWA